MKVGDYVRTNWGIIGKITKIIDGEDEPYLNYKDMCVYSKECIGSKGKIIKSSPNIIDLIEVGDYVNGEIVTKVVLDSIECNYIELDYSYNKHTIRNKDIKSIVTKEQFESMEYKIGE